MKKMTIDGFFKSLKYYAKKYRAKYQKIKLNNHADYIRFKMKSNSGVGELHRNLCPIEFLGYAKLGLENPDWPNAADELGIRGNTLDEILTSADGNGPYRKRMEKAVGLK